MSSSTKLIKPILSFLFLLLILYPPVLNFLHTHIIVVCICSCILIVCLIVYNNNKIYAIGTGAFSGIIILLAELFGESVEKVAYSDIETIATSVEKVATPNVETISTSVEKTMSVGEKIVSTTGAVADTVEQVTPHARTVVKTGEMAIKGVKTSMNEGGILSTVTEVGGAIGPWGWVAIGGGVAVVVVGAFLWYKFKD